MFRYFCRKHNCTVIKVSATQFAAEGEEENRLAANFEYERELGKLLVKVINARAKEPHRDAKRVTLETIRAHVKELYYGV